MKHPFALRPLQQHYKRDLTEAEVIGNVKEVHCGIYRVVIFRQERQALRCHF